MFRTTDSIHYVLKYSQTPPNGRYTIYEITKFTAPPDPTRDTSSPPLYTVHDRHSSGTFSKGVKTGLWEYYTSERKVSEEVYKRGRRISKRNCPCKS
ncbi:hypothetical protein MTX78_20435 [Hymenobacter tibetensis]|uniref:Uncharacterized protein n=1 Tax=Hymenobacter tibetensis TaxID=497967 RepID=A0ABY4CZ76_9BACT|nr:hypothetical protein [Hymenobacter tibetensis]UOG74475.1 hypothetical protein MTX78_20435 [Hymenobacter tibetensis]